jgi:hypothetical protein
LEVVSYSVLTNPTQAGVFDTHSLGKAAFYANDLLYFADSYSLYIFACGGSATVALGNVTGFQGMSVTVPITVSSLTGLNVLGWNTTVHFDTSIVHITGASITGTISTGMTILPVVQGDSIIIAAINPPAPLSGSGTLVNLTGTVNSYAPVGSVANLTFSNFMFNGGRPVDYTTNGSVTVTAMYNISGTITYYWPEVGGAPSPNHELDMSGNQTRSTFTNTLGSYAFTAVPYGNYIVHTQKDQTTWIATNIISFSDAVMAAQKAVGLITLTPNQITAADVSGNGAVTTYDATLIAMYSVRTLTPAYHFPVYSTWWMGQYTDWATNPAYVNYSPLNATTVTNYRAILFGDVTGNWSGTGIFANPVTKDELLGEYTIDGDEVTIPISVTDNPEDIEFVQGEMIYNPDKLEFLSFEATGILPSNWTVMENHNEPGHLRFGAANLSGVGDLSLVQTGELFNVSFKILDTKQAIELKLDNYFTEENGSRYTANAVILPSGIPTSYSLKQNYPNPFNPGTSIRFDLKEAGHVSLMIYNTLGQKVRTLVDGEMLPGAYSVEFNGLDDRGLVMASGLYFYQIKCNDFNDTKKMIITK